MVGLERLDAALSERFRRSVKSDNGCLLIIEDCRSVSRAINRKFVRNYPESGRLGRKKNSETWPGWGKKRFESGDFLTEQRGKKVRKKRARSSVYISQPRVAREGVK